MLQFLTNIEIIVESVIVLIDDSHSSIGRRNFQYIQQMPLGAAKVVGFSVKDDAVGNEIEVVIATTNALVTQLQQVLVLVDHSKTESTIYADYELRERHSFM